MRRTNIAGPPTIPPAACPLGDGWKARTHPRNMIPLVPTRYATLALASLVFWVLLAAASGASAQTACTVPADCDDGISCTVDDCVAGFCENVATDSLCDNGLFCDGAETCDPTLDCQAGTAPDVDDGVTCTVDS